MPPPWVYTLPIKKEKCLSHFKELFGMQHGTASQADAQQSRIWLVVIVHPLLCDLQLNYWTALGLLHHLRLIRTKGKTAAVRPDSLMLTKCSAIIRQKQHIIAWYFWKAKLSAGCLPRGICEWLWWQRAPGTEALFMLWSWVQDKTSTTGESAQAGFFVKDRGCRNCPQGPLPGEGTGRNLQRKAAERCVLRRKVSWGLPFYQNTEIVYQHICGPAKITCLSHWVYQHDPLQAAPKLLFRLDSCLDRAHAFWGAGRPGSLSSGKCLLSLSCLHSQQRTSTRIWPCSGTCSAPDSSGCCSFQFIHMYTSMCGLFLSISPAFAHWIRLVINML